VKEALNVFDFDAAARTKLSTAHYTFITDGSFNNETLHANREGFAKYELRMRRLTGITKVDQSVRLFGVNWESPIFLSPVGRMNAYYPQGAVVVARAANATRDAANSGGVGCNPGRSKGNGGRDRGSRRTSLVCGVGRHIGCASHQRVEATGCPTLVWTIDDGGANTIGAKSVQRAGVRDLDRGADERCSGCHDNLPKVTRVQASDPIEVDWLCRRAYW